MSTAVDAGTRIGEQFLSALGVRDFDSIKALFSEDVAFRALTPSSVYEVSGPAESTGLLRKWMGDATEFEMTDSSAQPFVDRVRVTYEIRLYENDGWYNVGQQAYCRIEDGRIAALNLVCSGFRPIDETT